MTFPRTRGASYLEGILVEYKKESISASDLERSFRPEMLECIRLSGCIGFGIYGAESQLVHTSENEGGVNGLVEEKRDEKAGLSAKNKSTEIS